MPTPPFSAEPLAARLRDCLAATAWSRPLLDVREDLQDLQVVLNAYLALADHIEDVSGPQAGEVLPGWAGQHMTEAPDFVPPVWASRPADEGTDGPAQGQP